MAVVPQVTTAQFAPSLPFNAYTSRYESFSYPTVVNPSLPNQARMSVYGGVNPFQIYSLDAAPDQGGTADLLDPRRSGRFRPYYATGRSLERYVTPAVEGDQRLQEAQAQRDEIFLALLQERDAARIAELRKQLEELNKEVRQDLGGVRRRTPGGTAGTAGSGSAVGTNPSRRTSRGTALDVPAAGRGGRSIGRPTAGEAGRDPLDPVAGEAVEEPPGPDPLGDPSNDLSRPLSDPGATPGVGGDASELRSRIRSRLQRRPGLSDRGSSPIRNELLDPLSPLGRARRSAAEKAEEAATPGR
jgi:hypothetical protein